MINISGIGIVGTFGRGLNSLEAVLQKENFIEPDLIDVRGVTSKVPVYSVKNEDLKDKALSRKMRRADRFSKMAVIAAADALKDSGLSVDSGDLDNCSVGIVLSTGFGPHVTTFDFLDGYLDYGETAVSPTSFSHSVHNAAASYISSLLGIRGPTQTVTDFDLPFQKAFLIAQSWLDEGRCENVLLGSVDELGEQMDYVFNRIYSYSESGNMNLSDNVAKTSIIPGEGAVFLLLSKNKKINNYCSLSNIFCLLDRKEVDVMIIDSNLMSGKTEEANVLITESSVTLDYRNFLGDMKIASAFNVAIGALILKNQCIYSSNDRTIKSGFQDTAIKTVSCMKYSYIDKAVSELCLNIN